MNLRLAREGLIRLWHIDSIAECMKSLIARFTWQSAIFKFWLTTSSVGPYSKLSTSTGNKRFGKLKVTKAACPAYSLKLQAVISEPCVPTLLLGVIV